MREKLQRPVDLARAHGRSTQAIRNYEAAGILPAAVRSPSGYRAYTARHAAALAAFLALIPGHGRAVAARIMQSVNRGEVEAALRLIDESHAELLDDRRTLRAVAAALRELAPVPAARRDVPPIPAARRDPPPIPAAHRDPPPVPAERGDSFVGPLAHRLGLRPATLRKWERAGLLHPRRDRRTGYRVYGPSDIRDAQLIHQLRRGGYRLDRIAPVMAKLRTAGGLEPLGPLLDDWNARLTARGRAMLTGAAALSAYLGPDAPPGPPPPG